MALPATTSGIWIGLWRSGIRRRLCLPVRLIQLFRRPGKIHIDMRRVFYSIRESRQITSIAMYPLPSLG